MSDPDDNWSAEERLLVIGLDDILSAAEIIQVARTAGDEPADVSLSRALAVTSRLIESGLAVAGNAPAEFVAWECSPGEAIERIRSDWTAHADPFVGPGEVVWLDLTPAGEAAARALLESSR